MDRTQSTFLPDKRWMNGYMHKHVSTDACISISAFGFMDLDKKKKKTEKELHLIYYFSPSVSSPTSNTMEVREMAKFRREPFSLRYSLVLLRFSTETCKRMINKQIDKKEKGKKWDSSGIIYYTESQFLYWRGTISLPSILLLETREFVLL